MIGRDPLSSLSSLSHSHSHSLFGVPQNNSQCREGPPQTMQPPPDQLLTIEPCDICGDIGFHEVIVTCIKCKLAREHCYCMRIYTTNIPLDWICESCLSKNGTTSPCKVNRDPGWQASKRKRPIAPGKVKFIPEDEVIKLSSGNFPAKPIPAKTTLLVNRKASVKSKNIISKTPSLAPKSNPSISPIVLEKLPRNGGVSNPVTDQHASCLISKGPVKEHKNKQLLGRVVSDKEVQTLDLQIERPTEGAPREAISARKSLPSVGSGGIICAVAECNDIEKGSIQSIQEDSNLYKFFPSSVAAWRGCFAASGKFYEGFEAHPPCTVKIKAFKFSSRMPPVLQLESLPRLDVFTDVFENDCPNLQDIALYFFPSDDTERSRKNLNSILEFMNAEKSMLRSSIDGVELLVFTSDQLNMHSRGTIASLHVGCFLWGVFRQSKIDKATEISPGMEPVDMDVDMIGGKDVVGRVDHVLNAKPRNLSQRPLVGSPLHSSSKKVEKKTLITSSNLCVQDKSALSPKPRKKISFGFSSDSSSRNTVKKDCNPQNNRDVPPPGFEANGRKFACKTAGHEKKPMVNGGRSVSNGACFVGLSGRGSVQPSKFSRL